MDGYELTLYLYSGVLGKNGKQLTTAKRTDYFQRILVICWGRIMVIYTSYMLLLDTRYMHVVREVFLWAVTPEAAVYGRSGHQSRRSWLCALCTNIYRRRSTTTAVVLVWNEYESTGTAVVLVRNVSRFLWQAINRTVISWLLVSWDVWKIR